jgi:DSF synthase
METGPLSDARAVEIDMDFDLYPFKHDFYAPQSPRLAFQPGRIRLYYSDQLTVELERPSGALWITMHSKPRPSFSPDMLTSYINLVSDIENRSAIYRDEFGAWPSLNYVIIQSDRSDIFSLGGDLPLLTRLISDRDVKALKRYVKACVDPLIRFSRGFHLPLVTLGIVRGKCFAGGFELLLACDIIIAESNAVFAFSDIRLNLFPGMGATTFLLRKAGERARKTIMCSGRLFTAQELHELGIIDFLVETGRGEQAARELIESRKRTVNGHGAMAQARRIAHGDTANELMRITELWVETAMKLSERELATMRRLVRRQNRFLGQGIK